MLVLVFTAVQLIKCRPFGFYVPDARRVKTPVRYQPPFGYRIFPLVDRLSALIRGQIAADWPKGGKF